MTIVKFLIAFGVPLIFISLGATYVVLRFLDERKSGRA